MDVAHESGAPCWAPVDQILSDQGLGHVGEQPEVGLHIRRSRRPAKLGFP